MSLDTLLDRVRNATGPDRELDKAIAFATKFRPDEIHDRLASFAAHEAKHGYDAAWIAHSPWHLLWDIPQYTASVDDALALVGRALPGWVYNVGSCQPDFLTDQDKPFSADLSGPVTWRVIEREVGEEPDFPNHCATAVTAPLAILAALLTALQSGENGK